MSTSAPRISVSGNSLARRLTTPMAEAAGEPSTTPEPTLDQMLAAFDPKRHGGEVMAGRAVGGEAFADELA